MALRMTIHLKNQVLAVLGQAIDLHRHPQIQVEIRLAQHVFPGRGMGYAELTISA